MSDAITFGNLTLKMIISYLYIDSLEIKHQINQHGEMIFSVVLEEKIALKALNTSFSGESIQLINSQTKRVLFSGVTTKVEVKTNHNVWMLKGHVFSSTYQCDLKKKQRSFQNSEMTYSNVFSRLASYYPNCQYIEVDSLEQATKGMLLQYDETDWQFMKRLAAKNQTYLVADILNDRPRWWIGLKTGKLINTSTIERRIVKSYIDYEENAENYVGKSRLEEHTIIELKSHSSYSLGDYLLEDGQQYVLYKLEAKIKDGLLDYTYKMMPRRGLRNSLVAKQDMIGLTLSGVILDIKGTHVKVHLNIDPEQDKGQAIWLPYATEGSSAAYFMPEIGSEIMVNFPQNNEENYVVTLATRSNSESYQEDITDTKTKILSNLQGKKIALEQQELTMVSDTGLYISLSDNSNIEIVSPSDIVMQAVGNLGFSSSGSISVSGDKGVTLQGSNSSSIVIATDIQLASSYLQYTGGSGARAIHSALEGSKNKNKKRKSTIAVQPIQNLNAFKISQQAAAMFPTVVDAMETAEQLTIKMVSKISKVLPAANYVKKFEEQKESSFESTSQHLDNEDANFRAKIKNINSSDYSKKTNENNQESQTLIPIKGTMVLSNGNRSFNNNKKEKISRIDLPVKEKNVKKGKENAHAISASTKFIKNSTDFVKEKSDNRNTTDFKGIGSDQAKGSEIKPQPKISAASSKLKNKQSSSNGEGPVGSGGFGVVNKGASPSVNPLKLISARKNELVKHSSQRTTKRIKNNIKLAKLKIIKPKVDSKFKGNSAKIHSTSKKKHLKTEIMPINLAELDHIYGHKISSKLDGRITTTHLKKDLRHYDFDPVDLISGAYSYHQIDFYTKGQQGINWHWEWDSANRSVGSLGNRVTFTYDAFIELLPEQGMMIYVNDNGLKHVLPLVFEGDSYQDERYQLTVENQKNGYLIKKIGAKEQYFFSQSRTLSETYYLTEIRNDNDFTIHLIYDAKDNLIEIRDSNNHIFMVKHNELGFISEVSDEQTTLVRYNYTNDGNLTSVIDQLGEKTEFFYEQQLMIERRDKNGLSFHWEYDDLERVVHTWGDGHLLEGWINYYPENGYNIVKNSNQTETRYYYDSFGLVHQIQYGDGRKKSFAYNDDYALIQSVEPDNQSITYTFNNDGRLVKILFSDTTFEEIEYDQIGLISCFIDRLGKKTNYQYNNEQQLINVTYDKRSIFDGEYGNNQKLLTKIKTKEDDFDILHDSFGRLILKKTTCGESTEWEYDSYGNCIIMKKETENKIDMYTYQYDKKNRLIELKLNGKILESYTYDAHDNVIEFKNNLQKMMMTYTKLDKVASILINDDKFEFSYNHEGQLMSVFKNRKEIYKVERNQYGQIISETVEQEFKKMFDYDSCGRVEKVTSNDHSWFQVNYDENSNVFEVVNSDGTWESYDYDNYGNIIAARNHSSEVILSYDDSLNLIEETVSLSNKKEDSTSVAYAYTKENLLESLAVGELIKDRRLFKEKSNERHVSLINGKKMNIVSKCEKNDNHEKLIEQQLGELNIISRFDSSGYLFKKQLSTPYLQRDMLYSYSKKEGLNRLKKIQDNRTSDNKDYMYDKNGYLNQERKNGQVIYSRTINGSQNNFQCHHNQQDNRHGAVLNCADTTYEYDQQGRMVKRVQGNIENKFMYYGSGLLASMESEENSVLFNYDCFGRLVGYASENGAVIYIWAKNELVLELALGQRQQPEMTQWITDWDNHNVVARASSDQMEYILQSSTGINELIMDRNGKEVTATISSLFSDVKTKDLSSNISRVGLKKISNFGLYYNRFRYLDEASGSYMQRSPLANFYHTGREYLYSSNATEKTSYDGLSEENQYDATIIGKYELNSMTVIRKILLKHQYYLTKPIRNHLNIDIGSYLTKTSRSIKGLDEFGIQQIKDITDLNLANRVENYLTKNQFNRPISLPNENICY